MRVAISARLLQYLQGPVYYSGLRFSLHTLSWIGSSFLIHLPIRSPNKSIWPAGSFVAGVFAGVLAAGFTGVLVWLLARRAFRFSRSSFSSCFALARASARLGSVFASSAI